MAQSKYTRPAEPLVSGNSFRGEQADRDPILPFNQVKSKLPVPILPDIGGLLELYWRTWEMVWSNLHLPKRSSGLKARYLQIEDEKSINMWDTAWCALFGVYGRRAFPFIDTLNNFYYNQQDDGLICRKIDSSDGSNLFTPFDPDGTGPNILAWVEWRNYRISGDEKRLGRVFAPLLAYHRWCRANRSWPGGLYWATGESSEMGSQPRVPDSAHHHQHWTWVDASMQAAISCRILERMANQLGEEAYAAELAVEHRRLKEAINQRLWNEEASFFQDSDHLGHFSTAKTIGAYWGLLDSTLISDERLPQFLRPLRESGVFKSKHRISALSMDSPGFDKSSAIVLPPANYMVLKGLKNIGKESLAHTIAANHLQHVAEVFEHTDTIWENYDAEESAAGVDARPNFAGWTGLSTIATLFEDIIGLRVDWPTRLVVWNRQLDTDRHYGVQNFPLGQNGTLSLMGDKRQVTVTTDVPLTLLIRDRSLNLKVPLSAGTREIDLT